MISIQDLLIEKFKEISKFMIWNIDQDTKNNTLIEENKENQNYQFECSLCGTNSKNNFICSKCKLIMQDTILLQINDNDENESKITTSDIKKELLKKNDCFFCK